METYDKNAIASGDCGDASGGDSHGLISSRDTVTIIPVVSYNLVGSEPKL